MPKMEFELKYDKYDLFKVLSTKDFTIEYLQLLEIFIEGVEQDYYNSTDTPTGPAYIVNIPKVTVDFLVFESAPDNIVRKFKRLDTAYGYVEFIKGKWSDSKHGYAQTAFRLNMDKIKKELYK